MIYTCNEGLCNSKTYLHDFYQCSIAHRYHVTRWFPQYIFLTKTITVFWRVANRKWNLVSSKVLSDWRKGIQYLSNIKCYPLITKIYFSQWLVSLQDGLNIMLRILHFGQQRVNKVIHLKFCQHFFLYNKFGKKCFFL